MTTYTSKNIRLRAGDRRTREAMRAAHDDGRHGVPGYPDVLAYWAEVCADCHAEWHYEHGPGRAALGR